MRNIREGFVLYEPDDVRRLATDEVALRQALAGQYLTVYSDEETPRGHPIAVDLLVDHVCLWQGGIEVSRGETSADPTAFSVALVTAEDIAAGVSIGVGKLR